MKKLIILFSLVLLVAVTIIYVKEERKLVGGPCSYKEIKRHLHLGFFEFSAINTSDYFETAD